MSFKLTPITAKIQKTTKGGVTNPFIKGVGVPMKEPAVAKQGGSRAAANRSRREQRIKDEAIENVPNNRRGSGDRARKRNANKLKTKVDEPIVKNDPPKPTKITGEAGSDLRRKQYDAKGWAYDDTIKRPKAVNTTKAKKGIDIKKDITTSLETKLDPKALKAQVAKVNSKNVSKRVSKKLTKAAKAVDEGRDKKADRILKRAARIENREIKKEDRKKARATKRKAGQASKAINPNS